MASQFNDLYIVKYDGDWCIMNGDNDSVIYFSSNREQAMEVCQELRDVLCEDCMDIRCDKP